MSGDGFFLVSHERRRLALLRRRRDRLLERLQNWSQGDRSYTEAEMSALTWAIEVIEGTRDLACDRDGGRVQDDDEPAGPGRIG